MCTLLFAVCCDTTQRAIKLHEPGPTQDGTRTMCVCVCTIQVMLRCVLRVCSRVVVVVVAFVAPTLAERERVAVTQHATHTNTHQSHSKTHTRTRETNSNASALDDHRTPRPPLCRLDTMCLLPWLYDGRRPRFACLIADACMHAFTHQQQHVYRINTHTHTQNNTQTHTVPTTSRPRAYDFVISRACINVGFVLLYCTTYCCFYIWVCLDLRVCGTALV